MSYRYLLFHKPFDVLCQFTNPDDLACKTLKDFIDIPDVYSVGRLDRDSEGLLLLTNHGAMKHRLTHPQFQHPRTYWVQVERCPDETSLQQLREGVVIKGGYQTRPAQVALLPSEPDLASRVPPIRFRKTVPTAWLSLTLTEGRNRQVRRMTAAVGHPTLRLVRVGMGKVDVGAFLAGAAGARVAGTKAAGDEAVGNRAAGKGESGDLPEQNAGMASAGVITLGNLQPGEWRDLSQAEVEQLPQIWAAGRQQGATAGKGPGQRRSRPSQRSRRGR